MHVDSSGGCDAFKDIPSARVPNHVGTARAFEAPQSNERRVVSWRSSARSIFVG